MVHPRGCGEQHCARFRRRLPQGSSPRVRGTDRLWIYLGLVRRFIPAGAGNREQPGPNDCHHEVHPRGCGEQYSSSKSLSEITGSSPRVRGTVGPLQNQHCVVWFIPAGAGNSRSMSVLRTSAKVHPRGCGEQRSGRITGDHVIGSSPRVRGTVMCMILLALWLRFIPAGAGNRRRASCRDSTVEWFIPAGAGNSDIKDRWLLKKHGSSPRVRGTVSRLPPESLRGRFIPAGAGNRPTPKGSRLKQEVHPRGCGEQGQTCAAWQSAYGSSPRVRGTVHFGITIRSTNRFIPAGAGNRLID